MSPAALACTTLLLDGVPSAAALRAALPEATPAQGGPPASAAALWMSGQHAVVVDLPGGVRARVDLLAAVGLGHRLHHRPAELSTGQQQRVAVARALANRPRVVLADEPTASIDAAHQQQVIDLLRTTCTDHGVALVVVTHAPEVSAQFPRRLRLEDFNRAAAVHRR